MFKCVVCGAELPDGTVECLRCKVRQSLPAKFKHGQLVKIVTKEYIYYNHVVDSYFNRDVNEHMYRLDERMAMPVYPEKWLEAVSDEEITFVSNSGDLTPVRMGGWKHPLFDVKEATKC